MQVNRKFSFIIAGAVLLSTLSFSQFDKVLKAGGVVAAISAFGKDMNNGLNKLWGREESKALKTKVVPILSVTVTGGGNAIGAAQVMGPPAQVDKVVAVAQPEARIIGNQVRLKAMIPVASKNLSDIRAVPEVGVSGIVDIKL